jgi:hypothetical protein
MLVGLETAREHLWRILLQWPEMLGEEPDQRHLALASRLLPDFRQALFGERQAFQLDVDAEVDRGRLEASLAALDDLLRDAVFGVPAADWLKSEDPSGPPAWAATGITVAARLLERVLARGWERLGVVPSAFLPALAG